jgi:glucose dehydrogenase
VHHDLWDYDAVTAGVVRLADGHGTVPALVQPTKQVICTSTA